MRRVFGTSNLGCSDIVNPCVSPLLVLYVLRVFVVQFGPQTAISRMLHLLWWIMREVRTTVEAGVVRQIEPGLLMGAGRDSLRSFDRTDLRRGRTGRRR